MPRGFQTTESEKSDMAICLNCGQKFSYTVPKGLLDKHPALVRYYQAFCSSACQSQFERMLEEERENFKTMKRGKNE